MTRHEDPLNMLAAIVPSYESGTGSTQSSGTSIFA